MPAYLVVADLLASAPPQTWDSTCRHRRPLDLTLSGKAPAGRPHDLVCRPTVSGHRPHMRIFVVFLEIKDHRSSGISPRKWLFGGKLASAENAFRCGILNPTSARFQHA